MVINPSIRSGRSLMVGCECRVEGQSVRAEHVDRA